jgi:hypothetical protein
MTGRYVAALALMALAASPAAGQEAGTVAPFVGTWAASGLDGGDGAPAVEPSAFDLDIEGDDEEIAVTWAPVAPDGAREGATVRFEEAGRPGVFAAEDLAMPVDGEAMAWLRIFDGALTLYWMEVQADGGFAIESRRLTPAPDGGGLDGEVVLVVDGHPLATTRVRLAKGG